MSSFFAPIQPIKPMVFFEDKNDVSVKTENTEPFSNFLKNAINEYESLQETADIDANTLALGDANNLAQIQINSLKAQAALQTTVQLTSRVVNAYKEIMQMQV